MARRMLIDASHPEETRVVVVDGTKLTDFDYEMASRRPLKGNIFLAKVIRIEPSLQAAFVEYGGNRHGFLAFSEIHPDYFQIPVADREKLIAEQQRLADDDADHTPQPSWIDRTDIEDVREENREAIENVAGQDGEQEALPMAPPSEAPLPEPEPVPESVVEAAPAPVAQTESLQAESPQDSAVAPASPEAEESSEPAAQALPAEIPVDRIEGPSDTADPADAPQPDVPHTVETLGGDDAGEERERSERRRRYPSVRQYKIQEVIKRRQILLVQVVKEERGNKGAALTTYLSLAGRYCVLMPNAGRGGGISRKISNPADRKRMKEMLAELDVPQGMGVILRTAGLERSKLDIKRDYEYLSRLWDSIRELTMRSTAPALIYEEGDLIKRSLRDVYDTDIAEVLVEGEAGYQGASEFMRQLVPHQADKVRQYKESIPLFHRYQVESQFDAMHSPVVQLKSGGYIVINPTEALVAIDVNSGRSTKERNIEETALRTNIEAAEEIARQVRLRDLAGLIVVDFIDMEENRHQRQVEHRVKDAMRNDRARIQIGRISAFGLLEMSRQRLRPSLLEHSTEICPHCAGTGRVRSIESAALHALRAIEEEGVRRRASEIAVSVPPNVALYLLNQKRHTLSEIERRYGFTVIVEADEEMHAADCEIERVRGRRGDSERQTQETARATYEDVSGEAASDDDAPGEHAEADDGQERHGEEDGEGRRRKRRRRRRTRREDEEGAPLDGQTEGQTDGPGVGANGHDPEASPESGDFEGTRPALAEADGDGAPLPTDQEAQEGDEAGDRGDRRRRRGRRGGRRRRRENGEDTGEQASHEGHAEDGPTPGNGAAAADDGANEATSDETTVGAPEADAVAANGSATSDTASIAIPIDGAPLEQMAAGHMPVDERAFQPEPMPVAPPVPPVVAAEAPQPAQPEPPPPPVVPTISTDAPPEKPKRGWWRR